MVLGCSFHHAKGEKKTRKLNAERVRNNTEVSFNDCKYCPRLKKIKEETGPPVITHSEHNHLMATDQFFNEIRPSN